MRLLECTREKSFCPLKQSQSLGNPFDGEVRIVIRGKTTRCITADGFSTFSHFQSHIEGLPCQRVAIIQPSHCVGHMLHCGQIALGILEDFSSFASGVDQREIPIYGDPIMSPLLKGLRPKLIVLSPLLIATDFQPRPDCPTSRVPIVISDSLSRSRQLVLAKWFYKTRRLWNVLLVP